MSRSRPNSKRSYRLLLRTADAQPGLVARGLLLGIDVYQDLLAPLLPRTCRFFPSCSVFAREALTTHGALRGATMIVGRVSRCHPWHPGGYDPVPSPKRS